MHLRQFLTDDDAASPAVGLALFAIFIVIIGLAVGLVVFSASDSVGDSTPTGAFTFAFDSEADNEVDDLGVLYSSDDNGTVNGSYERVIEDVPAEEIGLVRITYTDGPPLEAGNLQLGGNRLIETEEWATEYSEYNDSEAVANGERFEVWMHVEDELRIKWDGDGESAVLQRYERPGR